jgi:hypothetical protein
MARLRYAIAVYPVPPSREQHFELVKHFNRRADLRLALLCRSSRLTGLRRGNAAARRSCVSWRSASNRMARGEFGRTEVPSKGIMASLSLDAAIVDPNGRPDKPPVANLIQM